MTTKRTKGMATVNFPMLRTKRVVTDRVVICDRPGNYHEEGICNHNGRPWKMWRSARTGQWHGAAPVEDGISVESATTELVAIGPAHPDYKASPTNPGRFIDVNGKTV